jgi:hypothetical protein
MSGRKKVKATSKTMLLGVIAQLGPMHHGAVPRELVARRAGYGNATTAAFKIALTRAAKRGHVDIKSDKATVSLTDSGRDEAGDAANQNLRRRTRRSEPRSPPRRWWYLRPSKTVNPTAGPTWPGPWGTRVRKRTRSRYYWRGSVTRDTWTSLTRTTFSFRTFASRWAVPPLTTTPNSSGQRRDFEDGYHPFSYFFSRFISSCNHGHYRTTLELIHVVLLHNNELCLLDKLESSRNMVNDKRSPSRA